MFKVFVAREPNRELLADQLARFERLKAAAAATQGALSRPRGYCGNGPAISSHVSASLTQT
jgi:hypothetical protein